MTTTNHVKPERRVSDVSQQPEHESRREKYGNERIAHSGKLKSRCKFDSVLIGTIWPAGEVESLIQWYSQ
jgi:hypothetical protein